MDTPDAPDVHPTPRDAVTTPDGDGPSIPEPSSASGTPTREGAPSDAFTFAPQPPRREPADGAAARGPRGRIGVYAVVALVVVLAFGSGVGVGRVTAPGGGTAIAATPTPADSGAVASGSPASASPSPSDPLAGLPSDGPLLGSKTAKVQLTYWADFQCPFCARFAQDTLPQLASRIADGTVSVLHRDFVFLGSESLDAAIAVRCASEQGRFWPMHDAVYAAQAGENQGAFSAARLRQLAVDAGADATTFSACTQRHDVLAAVLADTSAGVRAGVKSTPTIDLPGRTFAGVPDVNALLAAIDAAAASGTQPTPGPSVAPSGDPWAGTTTSGRTAGPPSAPVTVELWVDYQAAGMTTLVSSIEPELRKRVDAGTARLVLRDLATLGGESVAAASLIRCGAQAGEASVWFAHDILGSSARGAGGGIFTTRALLWLAAKLGWDVVALDTCMADPQTAPAVQDETTVGTGLGLSAAPAVVVMRGGTQVAKFAGPSLTAAKVAAAVDAAAKK